MREGVGGGGPWADWPRPPPPSPLPQGEGEVRLRFAYQTFTATPTNPTAIANSTTARTGLTNRGRGQHIGQQLPPGDHRSHQIVPRQPEIDQDRHDVQRHRDLDQPEIDRVNVRQPVAPLLADIAEQRPLGVGVVIGAQPRRHLDREQGQHHEHHPAAGGVVADLGIRLPPKQVRQVPQRCPWAPDEVREPRRLAAGEPPGHAEQQQRDDAVPGQHVQLHPAAALGQPAYAQQDDERPMEQAGWRVPDAHRHDPFTHVFSLESAVAGASLTHRWRRVTQRACRHISPSGSSSTDR